MDGCRGGWLAVVGPPEGPTELRLLTSFPAVVDLLGAGAARIGVDMPIGLPSAGARACDREARRLVGPRRSSVFAAPVRPALASRSWDEASAASRAADGRGLSKQAWHLLPRIAEVDATMTPRRQASVVEVHPEVSFAVLAGAPLAAAKRTPAGRASRLALLATAYGDLGAVLATRPTGSAPDDVLDAHAAHWSAARHLGGRALVLGDGAVDDRGLRQEIVA